MYTEVHAKEYKESDFSKLQYDAKKVLTLVRTESSCSDFPLTEDLLDAENLRFTGIFLNFHWLQTFT